MNFNHASNVGSPGAASIPELEETPQQVIQNITNEMIKMVPVTGPSQFEKSMKEFIHGTASKSGAGGALGVNLKKKLKVKKSLSTESIGSVKDN